MKKIKKDDNFLTLMLLTAIVLIGGSLIYASGPRPQERTLVELETTVLPQEGIILPIKWGDLGTQLVNVGVIDPAKLEVIYQDRGGVPEEMKVLLYQKANEPIKMTPENANSLLNIFWAFGLANKNPILENGPMTNPQYGDAGNFASTGGWTLAKGEAMDHYSKYSLVKLTDNQQKLVERVSQNIYRPCCDNPTYFPDCNHGMAMLGLLELMATGGASEEEMYRVALQVNSYWFPDTYVTIAKYFADQEVEWSMVNAKEVLGKNYSSASGYQRVFEAVGPIELRRGGSCGV